MQVCISTKITTDAILNMIPRRGLPVSAVIRSSWRYGPGLGIAAEKAERSVAPEPKGNIAASTSKLLMDRSISSHHRCFHSVRAVSIMLGTRQYRGAIFCPPKDLPSFLLHSAPSPRRPPLHEPVLS